MLLLKLLPHCEYEENKNTVLFLVTGREEERVKPWNALVQAHLVNDCQLIYKVPDANRLLSFAEQYPGVDE